jgi:hypothetical protein
MLQIMFLVSSVGILVPRTSRYGVTLYIINCKKLRWRCHVHMIALMMGAASISETSVNFYQTTRRYNPEDSHLHTYIICI